MTSLYPIMLNLTGKKVVVVGGGKVAERKVTGLLGTGAIITVVSPEVTTEIKNLVSSGQIQWIHRLFTLGDIGDAFMIFAATNDSNVNQSIKKVACKNQLVTIADGPEESDFHVPAQVQRGQLTIAVSTGGASPVLAKKIREQLEQEFDARYEDYLEFLYWARQLILEEIKDSSLRKELLTTIVSPEFLNNKNRKAAFLKYKEQVDNFN